MEIKLSETEFKTLLSVINMSTGLMGYMNDFIDEPEIATRASVWNKIERLVLQQAYEQDLKGAVDFEGGEYHIKNELFEKNMELTEMYNGLATHQELSHSLAARDFKEAYTPAEIEKMAGESGYLGVEMHSFEEKYWKEFEEYEYERLRIVTPKTET